MRHNERGADPVCERGADPVCERGADPAGERRAAPAGKPVPSPLPGLERLSLNQMTTQRWGAREAIEGCACAGIPAIGLWRDPVVALGVQETARLARARGLRVSSLCRGGMFPAASARERQARIDDNRRAIDEAATLGAPVLVLVCGPAPDRDIDAARAMVEAGITAILPEAAACGVTLGVEPLHPVFAAERSVIVTLAQALDLAERLASPHVGVVIDTYHVWWDPDLYAQIARAAGRIAGFHVDDWLVPNTDPLLSRGLMGDGVIELARIKRAIDAAGYTGPIEVEIFNEELWARPGGEVLDLIKERYLRVVCAPDEADDAGRETS